MQERERKEREKDRDQGEVFWNEVLIKVCQVNVNPEKLLF